MKRPSPFAWFAALRSAWGRTRHDRTDPADMGTALGLDSITVIEFEASRAPASVRPALPPWQRRLARRSRL